MKNENLSNIHSSLIKYYPIIFIAIVIIFIFRGPLLFGKSFCVVDAAKYPPWTGFAATHRALSNEPCNDQLFAHYPRKILYSNAAQTGEFHRWNNRMMGGYPAGADPHNGFYDPFNILFMIFSVGAAFKMLAVLQWFLGGLFTYLFLRELEARRLAAAVGAIAFFTQPFFITHVTMPSNLQSAIWLPYLLWIFERMNKSKRPLFYVPLLAIGIALSFFGGFPPIFIFVISAWLFYCLCRLIFSKHARQSERRPHRSIIFSAIFCGLVLGAMLSAPQLFPTRLSGEFSKRKSIPRAELQKVSLPVEFLATLLNPFIFGRPTNEAWSGIAQRIRPGTAEVSATSFFEDHHYIGWTVLLLAVWAVRWRRKDNIAWIMFAAAALAILTLYGSPVLSAAYYLVPGFRSSRPDRVIFVWGSFAAFLAGLGCDELLSGGAEDRSKFSRRMTAIVSAVALILIAAGIAFPHLAAAFSKNSFLSKMETGRIAAYKYLAMFAAGNSGAWSLDMLIAGCLAALSAFAVAVASKRERFAPLIVLVMIIDAGIISHRFLTFQPEWFPTPEPASIRFLEEHASERRIARFGGLNLFPANAALIWGISDAQGRHALLLRHWGEYFDVIEKDCFRGGKRLIPFSDPQSLFSPLLDAAGVKYILFEKVPDTISFGNEFDARFRRVFSGEMAIYENLKVFPEAWVVPEIKIANNEMEAAKAISHRDFDPASMAVVEKNGAQPDVDISGDGAGLKPLGCAVKRRSPENVEIKLPDGASGLLVLADAWYPNWKAEVDGVDREVLKTDLAFQGVEIKKGESIVTLKYVDDKLQTGRRSAYAGAAVCILIWLTAWKQKRENG